MKSPVLPYSIFLFAMLLSLFARAQQYIPYLAEDHWDFMDRTNGTLMEQNFDKAEHFRGGYALVSKNGLWGALNSKLQTEIPIAFDKIEYLSESLLKASKGTSSQFFYGQSSSQNSYGDFALLKGSDSLIVCANKEGLYGLINLRGEVIIPFSYLGPPTEVGSGILQFAKAESPLLPWKKPKKIYYGAINTKGEKIIPFKYLFIDPYGSDLIKAETFTEQHIYTFKGKRIDVPKNARYSSNNYFDQIYLQNGNIEVSPAGKKDRVLFKRVFYHETYALGEDTNSVFQILDNGGKLVKLDPAYKYQGVANSYLKFCKVNADGRCGLYGLMLLNGKIVLAPVYPAITEWNSQYAVCSDKEYNGQSGLLRLSNQDTALGFKYRFIKLMTCGFIRADLASEDIFYDANLNVVTPSTLSNLIPDQSKIAIDQSIPGPLKSTYSHKTGGESLMLLDNCSDDQRKPVLVEELSLLTDNYGKNPMANMIAVRGKGRYYDYTYFFINEDGLVLTPPKYSGVTHYINDLMLVVEKDTIGSGVKTVIGAIDFNGRQVISSNYDGIKDVLPQSIIVEKHGVEGVISRSEEVIIPIRYSSIQYKREGYYLLRKLNKWLIADEQGKIISAKYDGILEVYKDGIFKVQLADQVFFIDQSGKEYRAL